MLSKRYAIDAEFQPVTDHATLPISIQVKGENRKEEFYLHPKAPIPEELRKHPTFIYPFILLDYMGLEWRERPPKVNTANSDKLEIVIFYSFKDIEFAFADPNYYRDNILPELKRTRRISHSGRIILPWDVKDVSPIDGKLRWHRLSIVFKDIAAMQGGASLKAYSENVGIIMPAKDTYSSKEKGNMLQNYIDDPDKFHKYATGDTHLIEIERETNNFYNTIAELIGIDKRDSWGMSTGKIVATMLTSWLSRQIGVSEEDFWKLTSAAGSEGITSISRLLKNKELVYLGMVDGGRAVRERTNPKSATITYGLSGNPQNLVDAVLKKGRITGYLNDIDIDSCYGSGLKNQKFAIGNPSLITEQMSLEEFLKRFESQLIPGLWYARVNWKNAPFNQDLLISKVEKQFTSWDMAVANEEDDDRAYDASMILTTRDVSHAALTHDILQCLRPRQQGGCSSNDEWKWLKKNLVVECAAIYMRKHRVNHVTPAMVKGLCVSAKKDVLIEGTKEWVEVDLAPLMKTLISERKKAQEKHGEKSPLDKFLKLIINNIYGVISSVFFSVKGTGISNTVIGNNITARARTLAWLMAKGFHSHLSITDGGVFDINRVMHFDKMSLHLLEGLSRDKFTDSYRRVWAYTIPLFETEIHTDEEMNEQFPSIDQRAWKHLQTQFPSIDILKDNQFNFKSKFWYRGLTIHSKVDYRLTDKKGVTGDNTIALRGMDKVWNDEKGEKVINPIANDLFDALEDGHPTMLTIETKALLSLSDWQVHDRRDELLPHDEVTTTKRFFSHTPLGERFVTFAHYKRIICDYDRAKAQEEDTAMSVALVDASYRERAESHRKAA